MLPHVRFNACVASVRRDKAGWQAGLQDGSAAFGAVVDASGHQGVPKHPPFAGGLRGEYLPSHAYRVPEPFRGKRVLVVGAGNSACDIRQATADRDDADLSVGVFEAAAS